jgi:hypothetical protein
MLKSLEDLKVIYYYFLGVDKENTTLFLLLHYNMILENSLVKLHFL